jgi:CBS domain-containing protein
VELVANLMLWERVRHVPVEDEEHKIVGLVSYRGVIRALTGSPKGGSALPVSKVMRADPFVIAPESSTLHAVEILRKHDVGCLPVVRDGRLVGVVTLKNFMGIAAELLEQKLKG